MRAPVRTPPPRAAQDGFTLLEALVAMSILAFCVIGFLGTRTAALTDATEARNWRLARELAEEQMSILLAGAHELPPESGVRIPFERYPGFALQILIGETAIASFDENLAGELDDGTYSSNTERLIWQRDRDDLRMASQKGMTYSEWLDFQREEELREDNEEQLPSEMDLEEVMVVIYFPAVSMDSDREEDTFTLKAMVSTLALEGMTPDQAQSFAESRGEEVQTGNRPPGSSGTPGTGTGGSGR